MNLDTRIQPVRPPLEGYYSRVMAYLCVALVFAATAYERGLTPLTGDDVAECIRWAVSLPSHVNVDQMIVLARDQAGARQVHRR